MTKRRAAAYIRVSTEDQLEYSPDSQLKKINEYADRNDFELADGFVFVDEGISGRKAEKRPAFMRMISLAKRKPRPFDAVLVWKYSRFARNREDSIVYKSMLRRECGIEVLSVSEQLGDDGVSILIEALLEAMDEYYSVNLAEEVRRGMNEKFSRGGVVSRPPFGYNARDGVFAPNENAETVRGIYGDFLGGAGLRAIAARLNGAGIRTARGNAFEARTVEYILTNPTYTGKLWRRNSAGERCFSAASAKLINGSHEAIISDECFERAAELMEARRKRAVGYMRDGDAGFALRGIVRCSACGATLTRAVKNTTLQCYRYARGQCSFSHSVSLPAMTAAVLERLCRDLGEAFISVKPRQKAAYSAHDTAAADKKRLARVQLAYENGIDTLEEYRQKKSELLARIAAAEAVTAPPAPAKPFCGSLAEILPRLGENAVNALLKAVCSKIVFHSAERSAVVFYRRK